MTTTNQTILKEQQKLTKKFAGLEKLLLKVVDSFEIVPKTRSRYRPKLKGTIVTKSDAHAHIERKYKTHKAA